MKAIITLCITICGASINLWAQNNNLQREVLFRLRANEKIFADEYVAEATLSGHQFAAIVKDTIKDEFTFVFNGKRIQVAKGPINVLYFNLTEENGYVYSYTLAGRTFVNIAGKVLPNVNGTPNTFGQLACNKSLV